jgi:putative Ig domain-containing protein
MRNCGKHLVLSLLASIALAGCGGGGDSAGGAGSGNLPPIIQGSPATSLNAGSTYSFTPQAADPDGDKLSFKITNKPGWATFSETTGALTGTPAEANVGMSDMITIEVTDAKAVTELPGFRIQVNSTTAPANTNLPPTIAGTAATTAVVGRVYNFSPVGDDPNDSDTLTFSIANKPAWATFTPATGQLTGTPTSADVGSTNDIVITVTDGTLSAELPAFDLAVTTTPPPANRAPTITGTPATTASVGSSYNFRPVGSDADGNSLVWSIQNKPSWASFSTSSGRLNGTPTAANVGTSARITIMVTDGTATASLPSFTIQVNAAANRVPVIGGTPATAVRAGSNYSWAPTATDADGDTLTFSVTNLPSWATFNTSTGRITGAPGAGLVGSYSNIQIAVTDGKALASLPAFAIQVQQMGSGTATVNWTAPTTNSDGSPLTNLAGFRVAYGQDQTSLDESARVDTAGATSLTVTNLTSGKWYFGVIAVNSMGLESPISNIGSKTIP